MRIFSVYPFLKPFPERKVLNTFEYNSISPIVSRNCPDCFHLVSQNPSSTSLRLQLCIFLATCNVSPDSNTVLMFHVPMLKVFLVVKRVVSVAASFRLSLQLVIHLLEESTSSSKACRVCWFIIGVSVVTWFLRGRVASPRPNLPPFSAGLRTVYGGVLNTFCIIKLLQEIQQKRNIENFLPSGSRKTRFPM